MSKKKLLIEAISTNSGGAIAHLKNLLLNFDNQSYFDVLSIYNNNILYILIKIYNFTNYYKTKKIKPNYIIYMYFNYRENKTIINKVKNYDNTKIDIINGYYDSYFNFDLKITKNKIIKKLDKEIYITYYQKIYILKDNNIKAIRHHEFYNHKIGYLKKYITYYINYYIIIYINIKKIILIIGCIDLIQYFAILVEILCYLYNIIILYISKQVILCILLNY